MQDIALATGLFAIAAWLLVLWRGDRRRTVRIMAWWALAVAAGTFASSYAFAQGAPGLPHVSADLLSAAADFGRGALAMAGLIVLWEGRHADRGTA